jgi:hypothetical protein
MRNDAMGSSRNTRRDGNPATVNAGITTSLLWALLQRPHDTDRLHRWFCLPPGRREQIVIAFVDEFLACAETDIEVRLDLTLQVLDLAHELPPCELTDMARQLAPSVERLVVAINLRLIWEEIDAGKWTPSGRGSAADTAA